MRRLINSATILSMGLYIVPPFSAQAQDFPSFVIDGQEVMCLPGKKAVCPEGALCVIAKPKNCEVNATAAMTAGVLVPGKAVAAPDVQAPDVPVVDDAAAADQAAADQAAADKAAADQAAADQAAADQAAADKASADQAAADQAAADKAAADQAAADAAAAQSAAEKAAADQAAADKAAADQAAQVQADADAAAAADAAAKADAAAAAEATTPAADAALPMVTVDGQEFVCLPTKTTACPDGAQCVIATTPKKCELKAAAKLAAAADTNATDTTGATDPVVAEVPAEDAAALAKAQADAEAAAAAAAAAVAADPSIEVVEAPVPTDEAVQTLESALDAPVVADETGTGTTTTATEPPVAAASEEPVIADGTLPSEQAPAADATVTTEVVTAADTRASTEEFAAAPVTVAPGKKTGLSDFEKVGLVALGALVIGSVLKGNRQVVSNSGDRVVVRQPDGTYQVYKDDNALLREPGSTVRTETYNDGSTRSIVQRTDGSQIVTIRDASGRVLQRVAYDKTGHGTVLIDDLQPEERIDVSTLPKPLPRAATIGVDDTDAALRAQLAADNAAEIGRKFSLRQIRTIPEVRYLAATIDVNSITFESGSSAIQPTEARKLNSLGRLITQMIDDNPNEVFLIEGHTDAVGSAASNLALSDRRAESVAKALTEYFDVPPENLVVQGYGEAELKIDTQANERANRRVAVRIITPLLRQVAN